MAGRGGDTWRGGVAHGNCLNGGRFVSALIRGRPGAGNDFGIGAVGRDDIAEAKRDRAAGIRGGRHASHISRRRGRTFQSQVRRRGNRGRRCITDSDGLDAARSRSLSSFSL